MPEGDVVLRTARRLDAALRGQALVAADLRWPTVAGVVDLAGRTVLGTAAVGKHLLTRFDDGRTLHTHLRMEGSWRVERTGPAARRRYPHSVRVALVGPAWTCLGHRLGMVDVVRTRDERALVGHLGPDVLAEAWDRERAVANVGAQGARPIGEVLLDQRVVAGLGTIYMAESLWHHRLSPFTPAHAVTDPGAVLDTARRLMLRSVAAALPTATGDVRRPSFVHARDGRPCARCGGAIRRQEVGRPSMTRPAYWCPACQEGPGEGT